VSGSVPRQLTIKQSLLAAISTMLVWGLEYYDIILFASLAPILEIYFFPSKLAIISAIETWGAFASTYFVRPIGAMIFGWIGDVHGRRAATIIDAALVGLATLSIGLLPTYTTVGIAAPVLLYTMRMLQGIGLGGEAGGGATWALELTPRNIRPYINGVMYSGLSWAVFYYGGSGYWPYVMRDIVAPKLGLPPDKAYTWALVLGMYGGIGAVIGELLSGFLIRLVGIRSSFIIPSTLMLLLSPLIVYLAFTMNPLSIYTSLLMGILFGLTAAPQTLYFTSIFPTEIRWSAVAFGWNINASIGPLTTAALLFALEYSPSSPFMIAIYGSVIMVMGALLVALGSLIRVREY